jgi:hypothetical protein
MLKNTVTPPGLVAVAVIFEGQFNTMGLIAELTVTPAEAVLLAELLLGGVEPVIVAVLSQVPPLAA